ncbi:site-2 protease family protein [Streptomyces sp. F-3]|uniref:site-2 protease family protein n=1 Tax=Streptomyces sp. F-3 TaxID=1840095 RepID=UPI000A57237B|nr:site-2 protease family protein [Streptomyces sp. F-3]
MVKATFSLGRVAGIRVGVHWSVLFIVVVLAVGLASRFPDVHPGRPPWQYWLSGILGAVVFILSLLAHELSHALVARRNGVEVDDITLWLLGGVARLKSEAPTPASEVRIAGVGPLVSLLLGVLFGALAALFGTLYGAGPAVETLAWLAGINILLAVFNALPAAPLDGGRLLRALVWHKTGSPLRATEVATGAGRALGWLLTGAGLYLVLTGAVFNGFWLVVVGWFIIAMASAEGGQAKLRELLSGVPVRHAMSPDPVTVPASLTVAQFLTAPEFRYRHSAFPVVDEEQRPVGLVQVRTAAGVPDVERDSPVTSVMIPVGDIPTPRPDDPLVHLLPALDSSPAHRALVVENGRVVGVVTSSDISRVTSWLASFPAGRGRAS